MKKALIIYGGWDGHQPNETTKIVKDILKKEDISVTLSETLDFLLKINNEDYDLIIINVSLNNINHNHSLALSNLIKNGVGFVAWHGGLGDSSRNDKLYQFILGGQFLFHPAPLEYKIEILDNNILKGINDFNITSERYYCQIDPSINVLATTTIIDSDKKIIMPVVWTNYYGKGKIFYSSLGHDSNDFSYEVKEILRRGIIWTTN